MDGWVGGWVVVFCKKVEGLGEGVLGRRKKGGGSWRKRRIREIGDGEIDFERGWASF